MSVWTDEHLSAYLDAALSDNEAAALEADLEADAQLRARLAALSQVDAAIKVAFDAPLHEVAPAEMVKIVQDGAPAQGTVIDFTARLQRKRPTLVDWRLPIAASLALAIGGLGGFSIGRAPGTHDLARLEAGVIDAENPLAAILANTPSQERARLDRDAEVVPILSFAAKDGRLCREFEIAADGLVSVGVACRQTEGWRIEALLAAAPTASSGKSYAPANGFNMAAMDAVLSGLGAGDAMNPEEEKALIKQGWRRP